MVSHRSLSRNGQHCGRTLPQRQSPTGPHRQQAPRCGDGHLFSAATVIRSRQSFRPDRCGLLRPRAEAQFPASRPCDHPPGATLNRTGQDPRCLCCEIWEGQRPRCPQPQLESAQTPKSNHSQTNTITSPKFHHSRSPSPADFYPPSRIQQILHVVVPMASDACMVLACR